MTTTHITGLTHSNINALRETLTGEELLLVELGVTVATFTTDAVRARDLVNDALTRAAASHGRRGHPCQSLHAVIRKLDALAADQPADTSPPATGDTRP